MITLKIAFWLLSLPLVGYAVPSDNTIAGSGSAHWQALNTTFHGRLQASTPFSRPCFSKVAFGVLGQLDEAGCSVVQTGYGNSSELVLDVDSFVPS